MVRVCLQCGDKGFSSALNECVKCQKYFIHRYCLDKLPEKLDEFVHWVCDICEVDLSKELPSMKFNPVQDEERVHTGFKDVDGQLTVVEGERRRPRLRPKKKSVALLGQEDDERLESRPSSLLEDVELAMSSPLLTGLEKKEGSCSATKVKDHRFQLVDASTDLELTEKSNGLDTSSKDIEGEEMVVASKGRKRKILQLRVSPSEQVQDTVLATSSLSTDLKEKEACCSIAEVEDHRLQTGDTDRKLELTERSNIEHELSSLHDELTSNSPLSAECKEHVGFCSVAEVDHRFHLVEESTELELAEKSNSAREGRNNTTLKGLEGQKMVITSEERKRRGPQHGHTEQDQHAASATNTPLSTELEMNETSCPAAKVDDHELSSLEKLKKERMEVKFSSANLPQKGAGECLEGSQLASGHLENNLTVDNREQAVPRIEPIWRGNFVILNKDYQEFDDGLVAHLSSKACEKVYEEAILLPSALELEMLAKMDCWPKSFQKSQPSDDNIALYFFPLDKRSEGLFDCLVEEMMDQELAMKAIVKNAELLIFASNELPLSYWRFQGKYYLWGVFRGQQAPASKAEGIHEGIEEGTKTLAGAKSNDAGSPFGPLSNNGNFGSGKF
ncbi:uncharacterized protein LOC113748697 [Coffea eugenioides]|uniref:uncharacterized protein LOC113748697 n=1 Tax=Coffea eugenioides TaxID=49369 RepID=UPI000F60E6B8|nr:uncharacterized protein LOC113748697 [Coffea eugenioides]